MVKRKKFALKLGLYSIVPFILVLCLKFGWQLFNANENGYQQISNAKDSKTTANKLPDKIDYIFDVKPILSDRCYLCHGPDEGTREAGLRLDIKENAYGALGANLDRYAIVPGNVETSQLVFRINNPDQEKMMPPVHSNLSLSDYEKQVLTKWIVQGTEWKDHWAFVIPQKAEVPDVSNVKTANEIDHFIANTLQQKGLKLSPKSSKEKLIRRIYFGLTGLPPSIEAIDQFINDVDENAFEKVVDQLLDCGSKCLG